MSVFSESIVTKINGYLGRYETKRSSILPILHELQDEYGWIKPEHLKGLSEEFGLPEVQVNEVATFYSMYRLEEPKKYRVLFCDNIVCHMMGADSAMAKIRHMIEDFEKKTGKPSPVSLQGVPCLGVCDGAPAMLVNKDRFLKVTEHNVQEIVSRYLDEASA